MANFINDTINSNRLQMAYNNFVLRFQPSSGTAIKAIITGLGPYNIEVFPFDNKFYLNAKAYLKALFDTNFTDTINMSVSIFNINSFIYLDDNIVKLVTISIEIQRTSPSQFLEKDISVLRGVENVRRRLDLESSNPPYTQVLQPNVIFWEGYPIDISIHNIGNVNLSVSNGNQNFLINITKYTLARLIISNGFLKFGSFDFFKPGIHLYTINDETQVKIKTIPNASACGIYVKWINEYGTYSYYLFDDKYIEDLVSSQDEVVNNDFENFSQTISKEFVLSRTSRNRLTCIAKKTGEYERDLLYSLGTSPKIWLYTKQKNQSATNQDWFEIQLTGHTFPVNTPNRKFIDIEYEFLFPENDKQII